MVGAVDKLALTLKIRSNKQVRLVEKAQGARTTSPVLALFLFCVYY